MSTKNLGPIGSVRFVLTFIGYKQTDKETDKPNLYIDLKSLNVIKCHKKLVNVIKSQSMNQ